MAGETHHLCYVCRLYLREEGRGGKYTRILYKDAILLG